MPARLASIRNERIARLVSLTCSPSLLDEVTQRLQGHAQDQPFPIAPALHARAGNPPGPVPHAVPARADGHAQLRHLRERTPGPVSEEAEGRPHGREQRPRERNADHQAVPIQPRAIPLDVCIQRPIVPAQILGQFGFRRQRLGGGGRHVARPAQIDRPQVAEQLVAADKGKQVASGIGELRPVRLKGCDLAGQIPVGQPQFSPVRSPAQMSRRLQPGAGLQRARQFDWDRTAVETLGIYRQALAGEGRGT